MITHIEGHPSCWGEDISAWTFKLLPVAPLILEEINTAFTDTLKGWSIDAQMSFWGGFDVSVFSLEAELSDWKLGAVFGKNQYKNVIVSNDYERRKKLWQSVF